MSGPPEKENARPGEPGTNGFGKHSDVATPAPDTQAGVAESAHMALTKAWLRCDRTARLLFLSDVRAGCPNLWRETEMAFAAERLASTGPKKHPQGANPQKSTHRAT